MTERPQNRLIDGVRERRERHRARNRLIRIVIAALGFLVVLAGLAMLVLPGPGLLVIAIGLGTLALEFTWAERLLERTVNRMEQAAETVKEASGGQQLLLLALAAAAAAAALVAVILWDVPFLPG